MSTSNIIRSIFEGYITPELNEKLVALDLQEKEQIATINKELEDKKRKMEEETEAKLQELFGKSKSDIEEIRRSIKR